MIDIGLGLLKMFWKPVAGVALAVALFFAWQSHEAAVQKRGYDKGYVAGIKKGTYDGYLKGYGAAITERQAADDQKLAEATTKARAAELAMQEEFAKQSAQRQQEKVAYEKTIDDLRADARRGDSGMRLPAGTCPDSGARVPADTKAASPGAAGGLPDPTGGNVVPEVADNVLGAAADLRQGVRQTNELIRLYNQCRATANASP
jgi:hypothetical protein